MHDHLAGGPAGLDLIPLTPMQQLMLVHEMTTSASSVLTNRFVFDLRGRLDLDAFQSAWLDLVARHDALRTGFVWEGHPHPMQRVFGTDEGLTLDFAAEDLRPLTEAQRAVRLDDLAGQGMYPFDVARPPLTRVRLARLDEEEWRLWWSCHHLVVDRGCLDPLFRDLAELYAARLGSRPPQLSPPGSFRDYVTWIAEQDPDRAESYWRAALRGIRAPSLVTSGTPGPSPAYETRSHVLDPTVSRDLRALARAVRVSLGSVLLTGLGLWLAEETAREDVVMGLTVSGRPPTLPDAPDTVGSFINNVPVRLRRPVDGTLADALTAVHRTQARRQPYEWVSTDYIRSWCDLPRGLPLYDLLVVLNLTDPAPVPWPGFRMQPVSASLAAAQPLTLSVSVSDDSLRLTAVHDVALLPGPRVATLLRRLTDVLGGMWPSRDAPVPARASLASPVAGTSHDAGVSRVSCGHDEPLSPVLARLVDIWEEILGTRVGPDHDLFALGLTSVQAAEGFLVIERRLGRALPLSTLFGAGSVREIASALEDVPSETPTLVELQPGQADPTLFVVPGECGELLGLAGLTRALGPRHPVFGLQSRGLDGRARPVVRMEDIGSDFAEAVRRTARGPFVILGLAAGAAMAFETALQLSGAGCPPAWVLLMNPPHLDTRPWPDLRWQLAFLVERGRFHAGVLRGPGSWSERTAHLRRVLGQRPGRASGRTDGAGESTAPTQTRGQVQRANRRAVAGYRPRLYRGRVGVLITSTARMSDVPHEGAGWWRRTTPTPAVTLVPGIEPFPDETADVGADPLTPRNLAAFAVAIRPFLDDLPSPKKPVLF